MINALRQAMRQPQWASANMQRWQQRFAMLMNSRWTYAILLLLGVVRVVLSMLAYAPAGGADFADYFLHAAYLAGQDLPTEIEAFPPVYPLLLHTSIFTLGSIYWLLFAQQILSIMLGIIYYWGLKPVSSTIAFLSAVIITFDFQTAVLFNFASTEPIYIPLLAMMFAFFSRSVTQRSRDHRDLLFALGVTLVLLLLTRSVARPLFIPVIGLLFLGLHGNLVRRLRQVAWVVFGMVVTMGLVYGGYVVAFGAPKSIIGYNNNILIWQPIYRSELLEDINSPEAEQLRMLDTECRPSVSEVPLECMAEALGSTEALQDLLSEVYTTLLNQQTRPYIQGVIEQLVLAMRINSVQYRLDSPAVASCTDLSMRVDEELAYYLEQERLFTNVTVNEDSLRDALAQRRALMCPPLYENEDVRGIVVRLAEQYRSLNRPNFWWYYGGLALLVLTVSWLRHCWSVWMLAGGMIAFHALVIAVIFNVQPRYVVIFTPFQAILLVTLFFTLGKVSLLTLDRWQTHQPVKRIDQTRK